MVRCDRALSHVWCIPGLTLAGEAHDSSARHKEEAERAGAPIQATLGLLRVRSLQLWLQAGGAGRKQGSTIGKHAALLLRMRGLAVFV